MVGVLSPGSGRGRNGHVGRVLLVGATDGLGRALAQEYLRRHWRVCIVGRDRSKLDAVLASLTRETPAAAVTGVACDVSDRGSISAAFADGLASLGGPMDLLVYCAGVLPPSGGTRLTLDSAAATFDVNVLGAIHFLELGAAYMEPLGRGRLAAVGSIAGERGRKGNPVYGASKAALHTYLEGLRHRLHPRGIGVSTIKPGFLRTRMLPEAVPGMLPALAPEAAARRIAKALERERDEFFVPGWWALIAAVLRLLPSGLHKRISPP